jgi:sensor c-di-GMP phosphodiesterase-like protein
MPITPREAREFVILLPLLVLVTAVVMIGFALAGIQGVRGEYERLGERALAQVTDIIGDADRLTRELESNTAEPCSPAHLRTLRRALFRSQYLSDLGYVENDTFRCSAGIGQVIPPQPVPQADFLDRFGNSYWIDTPLVLFDSKRRGVVIRRESYNVVLDLRDLAALFTDSQWELVYTYGDRTRHVAGMNGLWDGRPTPETWRQLISTRFEGCTGDYPYFCLAIEPLLKPWSLRQTLFFLLALLCSLFAGALAMRLSWLYLKRRRSTVHRVTRGLEQGSFYWVYQPIVRLDSGAVVGCEALARFRDRQGTLGPDAFIPALRDLGLSWRFTQRMLEEVIPALNAQADLPDTFRVGLNILPRDVLEPAIMTLPDHPVWRKNRLIPVLEVTEDEALDEDAAVRHLQQLNEQGFRLAIDDFGVGYSNLGQLRRVRCDIVKIDRSFIQDMEDDSVRSSLIPNIVTIARQLEIDVVAEGIENERQREALLAAGVTFGQGWHFGRPGTLAELVAAVRVQAVGDQR